MRATHIFSRAASRPGSPEVVRRSRGVRSCDWLLQWFYRSGAEMARDHQEARRASEES
jgi:hypothetical protein